MPGVRANGEGMRVGGPAEVVERLRWMLRDYQQGGCRPNSHWPGGGRAGGGWSDDGRSRDGRSRDGGSPDGWPGGDEDRSGDGEAGSGFLWLRRGDRRAVVATGLEALDAALPFGGVPKGAVTEILEGAVGVGATSFALRLAGRAAAAERPVVLVDGPVFLGGAGGLGTGDFYPPAVERLGLRVDQLVVVRPRCLKDAVWAADQCLRCPAVAAVIARLDRLEVGQSRRLQLAAESAGNLGVILRSRWGWPQWNAGGNAQSNAQWHSPRIAPRQSPGNSQRHAPGNASRNGRKEPRQASPWSSQACGDPGVGEHSGIRGCSRAREPFEAWERFSRSVPRSFAAVRIGLEPVPIEAVPVEPDANPRLTVGARGIRSVRVSLLKVREGMPAGPFLVGLDDEAVFVPLHSMVVDRASGVGERQVGA